MILASPAAVIASDHDGADRPMPRPHRHVVWFSCGAASAVAAKVMVETKAGADLEIVYCDTMSTEHPDNARFMRDVEAWIGRRVTLIRSEKYRDIDDVFQRERYMAGIGGAKCTTVMKKLPRVAWQRPTDTHIFGYTADESSANRGATAKGRHKERERADAAGSAPDRLVAAREAQRKLASGNR